MGDRGRADEAPQHRGPRRLNVTIPLATFNPSGGVKSLIAVANALAGRGHHVRFLVPDYAATPPAPLGHGVVVRVLATGSDRWPGAARRLAYLVRLSTSATAGADVCLANYFTTAYAAWLSRGLRRDRGALAYNVRAYEPVSHGRLARANRASRLIRAGLAWLSYRLPIPKICTTEWLREQIGDPTAYVVGHGIDLELFRPPDQRPVSDDVVIGAIARHGDVKGYPDFLRAVDLVSRDLPLRVLLAVPDPVPLPNRFPVETRRPTDEAAMAAFYAECHVFVFPSRAEGFGLPALEGMARGCAVLVTDCGGVRHFARPDVNCLMVPVEDPAALAGAITRLVTDADLRARLSAKGVEAARGFGRAAMHDRFCDYLERLAAASPTLMPRKVRGRGRARVRAQSCGRAYPGNAAHGR